MKPPNYRVQSANHGECCRLCEAYEPLDSRCKRYFASVDPNYLCDGWKRNPDVPVRFV